MLSGVIQIKVSDGCWVSKPFKSVMVLTVVCLCVCVCALSLMVSPWSWHLQLCLTSQPRCVQSATWRPQKSLVLSVFNLVLCCVILKVYNKQQKLKDKLGSFQISVSWHKRCHQTSKYTVLLSPHSCVHLLIQVWYVSVMRLGVVSLCDAFRCPISLWWIQVSVLWCIKVSYLSVMRSGVESLCDAFRCRHPSGEAVGCGPCPGGHIASLPVWLAGGGWTGSCGI